MKDDLKEKINNCYSGKDLYLLALQIRDSNNNRKEKYFKLIAYRLIELENTYYMSKYLSDIPISNKILIKKMSLIIKKKGIRDFEWNKKDIENYHKAVSIKISNPITNEEIELIKSLMSEYIIDYDIRSLDVLAAIKNIPEDLEKEIIFNSRRMFLKTGAKISIAEYRQRNYSDEEIIRLLQTPYLTEYNISIKDLISDNPKL